MLTTGQTALRRSWHATVRLDDLKSGPKPFRLLGEDLVLFLGPDGAPAALRDRCCHRTAKLSLGWTEEGQIVCGYHGWAYGADGFVTRIPQFDPQATLPRHRVPAFHCQARHGYAWVALDEPLSAIPDGPEGRDPTHGRTIQFHPTGSGSSCAAAWICCAPNGEEEVTRERA